MRPAPRAAAVCAALGGAGYLVVGFAHGDLPSDSVEHALGHVADTTLLAVLAARLLGADRIVLMGRHPARTDLGRYLGATDVVAARGD